MSTIYIVGVEGMSLLTALPDIQVTDELKPYDISEKAKTKLQATLQEILRRFSSTNDSDVKVRRVWKTWHTKFAPDSNCPYAYERKLVSSDRRTHLRCNVFIMTYMHIYYIKILKILLAVVLGLVLVLVLVFYDINITVRNTHILEFQILNQYIMFFFIHD
jgi:hypothetical protein